MTRSRPYGLRLLVFCLLASVVVFGQQPAPQPAKPKPAAPKPANPFESVPQAEPDAPKPIAPQTQAPKLAPPGPDATIPDTPPDDVIDTVEFRGARRVPQDTLRAMIFTKKGDKYDEETLHRDFMILWNTNRFDDITMQREATRVGWLIRFIVVERRVVRSIKYDGMKSITISEILDRFKDRKVGLSVESQYDPNKVQRARNVLAEYLAERGRQFATVEPEIRQVPPSSLEVTFKVNEGPKVKVGEIKIEGNKAFSDRVVIRAMRNLRPVGIPKSILAENLFPKTYDSTKFEEDQQRIQQFYQQNGYFTARASGDTPPITDVGGSRFRLPLIRPSRAGKAALVTINIEEGRRYHLNNINFVGVKLFRTPETLMRPVFNMGTGDIFSTEKLTKGLQELRKLYGGFGYIDFVAEPDFEPVPNSDKLNMTLTFDEGKQFFVRRIDFSGNTTTRDKVIRRELLIDEGDIFNTRLWELSILRLNQLGYFEPLKEEEAADMKRDTRTNTVDLTLKVKERGKNTVQMSGGVSGISGSFMGFSYSTNNFLGMGENLSISTQLGTRTQDISFGFTEPYFLDKPIQLGFTVFQSRYNYDQAREASILAGTNLISVYNQLNPNSLLNYISNSRGFTVFASTLLKRSFARVGISYGFTTQSVNAITTASKQYYDYLNFLNINGPNQLDGIRTSAVIPTYSYNSVNHPITPTQGKSISASVQFTGSVLGGNVNQISPSLDLRYFRAGLKKGHVIGMHFLGQYLTGYGGKVAAPFNRFYMGGENDVRGFQIWGVSPIAWVPNEASVPLLNNDGSPRQQKVVDAATGATSFAQVTQSIPSYQMVFPGGDTKFVANFEYRIPIFGPLTLALFADAGLNKLVNASQLKLNDGRTTDLNNKFPEAAFEGRAIIAQGTQLLRTSTGIEFQVLMPVVNAPFRLYWAYNPTRVEQFLQPPVVADRSYFPNQASFINSIALYGQPVPFFEKKSQFRFSVGRTF